MLLVVIKQILYSIWLIVPIFYVSDGFAFFIELYRHYPYICVGILDRGVLNQLVNLFCVFPIPDGDAKRHKAYTGSGDRCPTSSLRDRSYIPCTEVLVVGGYKLGERGS